jgi:hypothetical protein
VGPLQYNKKVEHSANYISQLECGKIRWPEKASREALRAILGVPTDTALGFVNARSARAAVKLESVDRQQFLRTSRDLGALAALGPPAELLAALLENTEPTPTPRRVGATDIEMRRINETLRAIGTADEHCTHLTPDNEPPLLAFDDNTRHAQCAGQPIADPAILGRATHRLAAAATGHTGNTHARTFHLAKLANLTITTGDPIHAATIGHAALDTTGPLHSRGVTDAPLLAPDRAGPPPATRQIRGSTAVGPLPRRRPPAPAATRPSPTRYRRGPRSGTVRPADTRPRPHQLDHWSAAGAALTPPDSRRPTSHPPIPEIAPTMPTPPLHPTADPWRDVEGTHIPLHSRIEQVTVDPQHGALRCRLHQQGQVIGRGTTLLYIRFDHGNQLIALRPHLVLDTPGGC